MGVLVSHLISSPSELGGGEGEAMVAGGEGFADASPVMLCRRRGPGGVDPTVSCSGGPERLCAAACCLCASAAALLLVARERQASKRLL